ncbi:DUF6432 family protein [Halobacteria archaeon AArc-m2/3/4]|uniref:DUF6432 family protein n=1 Tax=Natronoglomus mannanivorans TaxID=2979990 RepID=A0AAP2Z3G6_9EURY|nr:DUF6432 family protein [Halobacteria archaeon AArc-xg1-1]MCU4974334.1 DUF6432 family protein [Halobacteria archaeon AArc-m2/3/4]
MRAKQEYRDRESTEVAVLDELVNRTDDGMTVFELRAAVEVDIDALEAALADLKEDDLITAEHRESQTVIKPDERVVPDEPVDDDDGESIADWIRKRIPF